MALIKVAPASVANTQLIKCYYKYVRLHLGLSFNSINFVSVMGFLLSRVVWCLLLFCIQVQ